MNRFLSAIVVFLVLPAKASSEEWFYSITHNSNLSPGAVKEVVSLEAGGCSGSYGWAERWEFGGVLRFAVPGEACLAAAGWGTQSAAALLKAGDCEGETGPAGFRGEALVCVTPDGADLFEMSLELSHAEQQGIDPNFPAKARLELAEPIGTEAGWTSIGGAIEVVLQGSGPRGFPAEATGRLDLIAPPGLRVGVAYFTLTIREQQP